jgi:DNA invertase Pin-like site-specific DNA recombinase
MVDTLDARYTRRTAILYVRQSSSRQVEVHEESRRLQYRMKERLAELGCRKVEVIDEDLGKTASGKVERTGFARMVAQVRSMGKVGVVAARDVSRLARNSRDWYQLLELCAMVDAVLVDHESVYDPRRSNDRLLLGLKGNLSAYELDLMQHRLLDARRAKAARGEMYGGLLPVGYCKGAHGGLEKNPDRRVQETIELVFAKCLELGSLRRAVIWMQDHELQVPVRYPGCRGTEHEWRPPMQSNLLRIVGNPMYCGAYAWGRTHQVVQTGEGGRPRLVRRRRPKGEYEVLLHDHHEGYVSREDFDRLQAMLANNRRSFEGSQPGIAGAGRGLLAGILRCGRCGRSMTVGYQAGARRVVRYVCPGEKRAASKGCIGFVGTRIDELIGQQLLEVVSPAARDAAREAECRGFEARREVLGALERDLEAARYAASLARRQYDKVDPDNRLVAAELESRWNDALLRVEDVENRLASTRESVERRTPTLDELNALADDLTSVWQDVTTDMSLKKRIARTLIEEVIVDFATDSREMSVVIHWKGGVHTEHRLQRRRRGEWNATSKDTIDAIRVLTRVLTDRSIAVFLARSGLRTASGKTWSTDRVRAIRCSYDIPVYSAARQEREGWLTLGQAAARLNVTGKVIRSAIDRGALEAEHPLRISPWILSRDAVDRFGREYAAQRDSAPLVSAQQNLAISNT